MKKIIKNIFIILDTKEKKHIMRLIFFDILISILDITFLAILLYIIQFYTQPLHSTTIPYFPFNLINPHPLLLIVAFAILFSIKNWIGFYVFRMRLKFVYNVASRLSGKNLMNYLQGSYNDYINIDSSVYIRKISQQPIEFCHYVLISFQQIINQSVLIMITVVAILIYNPVLFPLLFLILVPPVILAGSLMKKKLKAIRKSAKPVSETTIQYLKEALSGFIESNLYNSKSFFANRYRASQSRFNNFLSDQLSIQNLPSRLMEVFAIFGLLILILINSFTSHTHSIQIITIGAFMAAAYKIIPGIVKILNSSGQIKTYEFTITDLLQSKATRIKESEKITFSLSSLAFKNISFKYNNELVLDDVSFIIAKGDFIGISGISGKGKTTIINLLLGFLTSDSGDILMNDSCADASARQGFWKDISYVKQQPLLIYDSILKNITLNEKIFDFQKLEEVLRVTGLKEIVSKFPEGYNKIITEEGKNLSGGQRQRIAIARALYKDADVIILDEPFSELDQYSEEALLKYFVELSNHGKTVILITHNKQSLLSCNKIISLDEKRSALISDINTWLS